MRRPDFDTAAFRRVFGVAGAVPTFEAAVPLSTLIAVLVLPLRRTAGWPPWVKALAFSAAAGTVTFVLSAAVNGTGVAVGSTGQFAMCVLFLVALRVTLTSVGRAAQYLSWLSLSMIGYYLIVRPENTRAGIAELWKYGIAYPVTVVALYVLVARGASRRLAGACLVILGSAGLALDFRSYGLVCMGAAVATWAVGRGGRVPRRVIGIALGAVVLSFALPSAISAGWFGDEVRARTIAQGQFNGPMLLAGRTEPPLSIAAISSRPVLGWGNAQTLDADTVSAGVRLAQAFGMGSSERYVPLWVRSEGRISLHSILFGSWVEGGVVAVIFPVLLIVLFGVGLVRARGRFAILVALTSLQGIWDVLFSPWGGNKSVVLSAYAMLAALAIASSDEKDERPRISGRSASVRR